MESPRRRGRPRRGEEEQRRNEALDAAFDELCRHGYDATTMLKVARRARSSKETLYAWFGNKEGLFAAVIRREASTTNHNVARLLDSDRDPRDALVLLATNLLRLLTSPRSVAVNKAAMQSPDLARVLLQHGRHTTGPLIERYLQRLVDEGLLSVDDVGEAFQLFYGLVIQDHQIRTLLGEPPPTEEAQTGLGERAVVRFLRLASANP